MRYFGYRFIKFTHVFYLTARPTQPSDVQILNDYLLVFKLNYWFPIETYVLYISRHSKHQFLWWRQEIVQQIEVIPFTPDKILSVARKLLSNARPTRAQTKLQKIIFGCHTIFSLLRVDLILFFVVDKYWHDSNRVFLRRSLKSNTIPITYRTIAHILFQWNAPYCSYCVIRNISSLFINLFSIGRFVLKNINR